MGQGQRFSEYEGTKERPHLPGHLRTVLGRGRKENNYLLAPGQSFAPQGINSLLLQDYPHVST